MNGITVDVKGVVAVIVRKKWLLICFFVVTVGILTIIGNVESQELYSAKSSILVIGQEQNGDATDNASRMLPVLDSVEILKSDGFLQNIVEEYENEVSVSEIRNSLEIEQKEATRIIELKVTTDDAEKTQKMAVEIAQNAKEYIDGIYGKDTVTILGNVTQTSFNKSEGGLSVQRIFLVSTALTVALTLVMSMLYIFNNAIKSEEDIKQYTNIACLGIIKKFKKGKGIDTKDIEKLRLEIMHLKQSVFVFTSSIRKEGKSQVSYGLAQGFAQIGKKVLLVDTCFTEDKRNEFMREKNHFYDEVTDYKGHLENYINRIEEDKIDFLCCKSFVEKQGVFFLKSSFLRELDILKKGYDYIFIDSTSLDNSNDAIVISDICDAIVFIIEANAESGQNIEKNLQILKKISGKDIYTILNKEQGLGKIIKRVKRK